jgi:hypothetical protein
MSGLKLKTHLPEHIFKPQRTEFVLPKELTDALTLLVSKAAAKHTPVDTTKPGEAIVPDKGGETQRAGAYDLKLERGPLGFIESVVAIHRDTGEPRWRFDVRRNAQLGVEGVSAIRL